MKKKTEKYLIYGGAAVTALLLWSNYQKTGSLFGLGKHHGHSKGRHKQHHSKPKHGHPRLTNSGRGSPLSCCSVPPSRCPVDFEVTTSDATFGDCGQGMCCWCNFC